MPLVRIAHGAAKSDGYAKALSTGVHRALVAAFNIPADDYFQIVTEHIAGAGLFGPAAFLELEHTADLVMVQITCTEGRSVQQKKTLYAAIAENLSVSPGVRTEDVVINLIETRRENWSFGNGIAQFAPAETQAEKIAGVVEMSGARLLHTMLRVRDLDSSLAFYTGMLGMRLLRRKDFPDGRFTLAFVGYGAESETAVLELTHNWDEDRYTMGSAYGHLALGVQDVAAATHALAMAGVTVTRAAGPLQGEADEIIAFIADPDGYRLELVQRR